jgi:biopolymer transport protein ExbD
MMRLTSRKLARESKLELAMTPMIDVVFLLLIFFMLTTAYTRPESFLDPAIKVRERAAATSPSDLEPAIVEVVQSGESAMFRIGAREIATQDELTSVLRQFPNKLDGAFVRVHDDVPFGFAAAAIQACKSANFTAVSYIPWKP